MDEEKIILAKKDKRVEFDFLVENHIHVLTAIPQKVEKIVIYCHGLGSDKTWAIRYYEKLLENNIGIVSFDLPSHGMDTTNFKNFRLELCISYLEEVIKYVKKNYPVKIYLFGSSYGGFVTLNKLMIDSNDIEKTILMCPAIHFCEITQKVINFSEDYFDTHEFIPIFEKINLSKEVYLEFQKSEENIKKYPFHDIWIIHGKKDKTVLYSDIEKFCLRNGLYLETIEEAKHELHGYEEEIVHFIQKVTK